MVACGYPPCSGGMMISNPAWTRTEGDFRQEVARWTGQPDGTGLINLAALVDGAPVAGDSSLFDGLHRFLYDQLSDAGGFLSHFARPILQFDTPIGFFHRLLQGHGEHAGDIDVKKGGIFPIVHGVRALALERHVDATNSFARIEALAEAKALEPDFAADLAEALQYLMEIRLMARLAKDRAGSDAIGDNFVHPDDLSRLQHEGLRDSLIVTKRFKERLSYHFRLDAF